ncbi:MAG: response regulator [Myxococcales bacterium]|nr:response regulator [Myxococcales bacterium]
MLKSLRRAFRRCAAEVEVEICASGAEALLRLGKRATDAVLVDLSMPEVDGFLFCRRVREQDFLANVRLIAMSARVTPERTARALAAGALACIEKPFEPEEVLRLLRWSRWRNPG